MTGMPLFLVCGVVACLSAAALLAGRHWFLKQVDVVLSLPPMQIAVLMSALVIATVFAQKRGTNAVPDLLTAPRPSMTGRLLSLASNGGGHTVTLDEVMRGWKVFSVVTNTSCSYAMPEDANLYSNWWVRGAYEDVTKVDFGGWWYPRGTNAYQRFWANAWGRVRPHLASTQDEIVATGTPMSAVPGVSRFWTGEGGWNSRLITWENFFLNRDTNTPVSAQIELFPNGDFTVRSNEVETICHAIDPNDWDGDWWPNVADEHPVDYDDFEENFLQDFSFGANTSAYYWVEISCAYNTRVVFVGDGESNLADPAFSVRAGGVYRVMLLIGKTYMVFSDWPLEVVNRSNMEIDVEGEDSNTLEICWPVSIASLESNGGAFTMSVTPSFLGGSFAWTQHCCAITGYGNRFWYAHDESCFCSGCAAYGNYEYEGYSIVCVGGWCCCPHPWQVPHEPHEDNGPHAAGAHVDFTQSAVIFEDAYTNRPGEIVSRRSTQTTLMCRAYGGTTGGTAWFSMTGGERLANLTGDPLPVSVFVPPEQAVEFEIDFEGIAPSEQEGDIVAEARFVPEEGETTEDAATLTSIRLTLEAVYDAPENHNPSRHVYGVGEKIRFSVLPVLTTVSFSVTKGDSTDIATFYDTFSYEHIVDASVEREYVCPATGGSPLITVINSGCCYYPIMTVIEPSEVITPVASCRGAFWPGEVVMGLLVTTNYIGPMTVSFQGIKVVELPCTDEVPAVGYFSTLDFNGYRTHCTEAGAGWSHLIGIGNYWTADTAGRLEPYQNWTSGKLIWKIPIGWKRLLYDGDDSIVATAPDFARHMDRSSRPLLIGGRDDAYIQKFEILPDGASAVEKFGYRLQRSRWSINGSVSRIYE